MIRLAALLLIAVGTLNAKPITIVDTAVSAGSFKTLVTALKTADLVEALEGEGPFTVFAPSDEAFGKLPEGTLEKLLKPENRDQLTSILKYHVVPGKVVSRKAKKLDSAQTLLGKELKINRVGKDLYLNKSKVVQPDIRCSNGVIHVIDSVLLPPKPETSSQVGRKILRMAIHAGVPLFNHGRHAHCASVYEAAARTVVRLENSGMNEDELNMLKKALGEASSNHCHTSKAWIMRMAFDKLL